MIMKYQCKCGCTDMFTEKKGNNTGLYCSECGRFQKWIGKNELRAFEHEQKEKEISIKINGNLKNIYENTNINIDNLDIVNNLNEFINFLDKEIDKILKQKDGNDIAKYTYANTCENIKENLINIVNGRRYDEYDM